MIYIDYNWHLPIYDTNQCFSVDQQTKLQYAHCILDKSDQRKSADKTEAQWQ